MPATPSKRSKASMVPVHNGADETLRYKYLSGTVVPQRIFVPRGRAKDEYFSSIEFTTMKPGCGQSIDIHPGISLQEALEKGYGDIVLVDPRVSLPLGTAVDIHVQWPGRWSFHEIVRKPRDREPWTRVDLAYAIAKCMKEWSEAKAVDDEQTHEFLLNTVLLEVRQVAYKGWQPVFMEDEKRSAFLHGRTLDSALASDSDSSRGGTPEVASSPSSSASGSRATGLRFAQILCPSPDREMSP